MPFPICLAFDYSAVASEIICLPERPPDVESENVTLYVGTYQKSSEKFPVPFELDADVIDNYLRPDGAWSANESISRRASHVWIFKPETG